MRTERRALMLLGLSMSVAMLGGCDVVVPKTYRYRMTVEVDTPQGLRSGSSVIEASFRKGIPFPGPEARGTKTSVRGEAVAVDLPGGTLFALLRSEDDSDAATWYAANAFNPHVTGADAAKHVDGTSRVSDWKGSAVLQRRYLPILVRFREIGNPKSVEAVNPHHLGVSFGPGTQLKRIVINMTNAPVTSGISKRLTWLGRYPESGLDNDFTATTELPTFAQRLSHGDFRKDER